MNQADCFFNKPARGVPSHPWVIISDPAIDPDNVLIVNLTDAEGYHDRSCVLDASDHPGVFTKPSCVAYQWAKLTSVAVLETALANGLLFSKSPVSSETLQKILDGAQDTDELKNAHREILREQGLIS